MPESNTRNYRRDQRRGALSPQPLHVLEAERPAGLAGGFQRPQPRGLHGPPRADQHPAPGPGHAQRPPVRRGRPRPGPAHPGTGGERPHESRIDFMARRLLARPLRPEELQVVRASVERLIAFYQSHPEDAAKLLAVGELKPDPAQEPAIVAAWTMLANELMNLDEVLNK